MSVTAASKLHAIVDGTEYSPLLSSDLFVEVKRLCTPRHMEVMQLLDDGLNLTEISKQLGISRGRVHQIKCSLARRIRRAQQIIENREL